MGFQSQLVKHWGYPHTAMLICYNAIVAVKPHKSLGTFILTANQQMEELLKQNQTEQT